MFPFQFLVPVHVATTNDYVKIKTCQEKLSSGYGFVGDKMKGLGITVFMNLDDPQMAARKAGHNQIFRKIHRKTLLTEFYLNFMDVSLWSWPISSDDQQTKSECVK